jgi:hypothetical protein
MEKMEIQFLLASVKTLRVLIFKIRTKALFKNACCGIQEAACDFVNCSVSRKALQNKAFNLM